LNAVGDNVQTTIFTNGCGRNTSVFNSIDVLSIKITIRLTIFADSPSLHDFVTGISGSFDSLIEASKSWLANNARVEWIFIPLAMNVYGETYWHRQHQLSEMFYCTMHEARLVETKIRKVLTGSLQQMMPELNLSTYILFVKM
jgi:hypothetical protein